MGVLVWAIIPDTSLGLGSLHPLCLITVYLEPWNFFGCWRRQG